MYDEPTPEPEQSNPVDAMILDAIARLRDDLAQRINVHTNLTRIRDLADPHRITAERTVLDAERALLLACRMASKPSG